MGTRSVIQAPEDIEIATITLQEAQATLPELIHRLAPGEEVILMEDDRPVGKLVAATPLPRPIPKLSTQRGSVLSMEHFDDPLEEFGEYG